MNCKGVSHPWEVFGTWTGFCGITNKSELTGWNIIYVPVLFSWHFELRTVRWWVPGLAGLSPNGMGSAACAADQPGRGNLTVSCLPVGQVGLFTCKGRFLKGPCQVLRSKLRSNIFLESPLFRWWTPATVQIPTPLSLPLRMPQGAHFHYESKCGWGSHWSHLGACWISGGWFSDRAG